MKVDGDENDDRTSDIEAFNLRNLVRYARTSLYLFSQNIDLRSPIWVYKDAHWL